MIVVTFTDYEPIARYDGKPWTQVKIEEGPSSEGPWTEIETQVFADPDADPAHPKIRNFTTELGTLINGWYKVTFLDASNDKAQPTAPIQNVEPININVFPSLAELAETMRARTKDAVGVERGTFTVDTRPTDTQARSLIVKAARDVSADVGTDIPNSQIGYVKNLVALRAAMYIELSYFPEQVAGARSPYEQYRDMYKEQLGNVLLSLEAQEASDTGTPSHNVPAFDFPVDDGWMTRAM